MDKAQSTETISENPVLSIIRDGASNQAAQYITEGESNLAEEATILLIETTNGVVGHCSFELSITKHLPFDKGTVSRSITLEGLQAFIIIIVGRTELFAWWLK